MTFLGWWKRERFKGSWWPPTFGDEKVTVWIIRQFIICLIFVGLCLRLSQTYSQLKMASLNSRVTSNWSVLVEKNSPMGIFHMQKGSPGEKNTAKRKWTSHWKCDVGGLVFSVFPSKHHKHPHFTMKIRSTKKHQQMYSTQNSIRKVH